MPGSYVCPERGKGDPAYAAASEECDELYRQIEEKLGGDRILVNRFDAVKNNQLALDRTYRMNKSPGTMGFRGFFSKGYVFRQEKDTLCGIVRA